MVCCVTTQQTNKPSPYAAIPVGNTPLPPLRGIPPQHPLVCKMMGRSMTFGSAHFSSFEDRYEIVKLVGRGGMGEVYAAYDRALDRQVALKLVRLDYSHDPQMRQRFYKEARALLLLRQPHIVEAYDFGMTGKEQLYLSMELVRGRSLYALRHTPLPLSAILDVVCQLLRALGHAHARGIVHRDIKPENVLISICDEALFAKLVDFGLAMRPANSLYDAAETVTFGTPGYIAPEQIAVGLSEACPATDIYSVGSILYELVCGKLPFAGHCGETILKAQLDGEIRPFVWREHLKNTPEDVRRELEKMIRHALSPHIWERYLSASDFRRELVRIKVPVIPLPHDDVMAELWDCATHQADERNDDADYVSKMLAVNAIERVEERAESVTSLDDDFVEMDETTEIQPDAFGVCRCPGRENLWIKLDTIAKTSLLGVGKIFCIVGNFGVGKSYLLKKIAAGWSSLNACILHISCLSTENSDEVEAIRQSAGVFWTLLGALLGTVDGEADKRLQTRADRVEFRLRELGITDISFLSAMRLFMEKPPLDPSTSLTPALVVMQNVERLAQIIIASLHKPLFILIDDVQRCSEAVFEFLLQMKALIANERIFIVMAYEPTEVHALYPGRLKIALNPRYQALFNEGEMLEALGQPDLMRVLMSGYGVSQTLATRIAQHSWGNLYYAVTTIDQLKHDARLTRNQEGELELMANDNGHLPLSKDIHDYFQRRFDAIGCKMGLHFALYREVLLRIAVLGDRVDMAEMETVWSNEDDVALMDCWFEAVAVWCEYGILRVEGTNPRWAVFCEPWLPRAIELQTSMSKVRELHRRAAMIYEKHYPEPTSDQLTSIAHHWEVAKERVAFVHAGRVAAAAQRREGNLLEAQHIFHDMLKLWMRRREYVEYQTLATCIDWLALFWKYGQNSILVGDTQAIAAVHDALQILAQEGVASGKDFLDLFVAQTRYFYGDSSQAKQAIHAILERSGIGCDVACEAEWTYARILIAQGKRQAAIPLLENLRQQYLKEGLHSDDATVATVLAHQYWLNGDTHWAEEIDQLAFDVLAKAHSVRRMTELEAMRACRAFIIEPSMAAVEQMDAVAGCFEVYGDILHEQAMFPMRFFIDILMDRYDHVHVLIERAKKLKRDYPDMVSPPMDGYALIYDGLECLTEGMTFEARHAFDDAKAMLDAEGSQLSLAFVYWLRALFALDEGDESQAGQYLEMASERMHDLPWTEVAFDVAMAMRFNVQNRSSMASEYAENAVRRAEALGAVAMQSAASIVLLEAYVTLRDLDAVKSCLAHYVRAQFPPRIAPIFEHAIERIMDRLRKLPASFEAVVKPVFMSEKDVSVFQETTVDVDLSRKISQTT